MVAVPVVLAPVVVPVEVPVVRVAVPVVPVVVLVVPVVVPAVGFGDALADALAVGLVPVVPVVFVVPVVVPVVPVVVPVVVLVPVVVPVVPVVPVVCCPHAGNANTKRKVRAANITRKYGTDVPLLPIYHTNTWTIAHQCKRCNVLGKRNVAASPTAAKGCGLSTIPRLLNHLGK